MTELIQIALDEPLYRVAKGRFGYDGPPMTLQRALERLAFLCDLIPEEAVFYEIYRSREGDENSWVSWERLITVDEPKRKGAPLFKEVSTGARFAWTKGYPLPVFR